MVILFRIVNVVAFNPSTYELFGFVALYFTTRFYDRFMKVFHSVSVYEYMQIYSSLWSIKTYPSQGNLKRTSPDIFIRCVKYEPRICN